MQQVHFIGRIAGVGSELATHNWLMKQSTLGELLAVDYEALPFMTMCRAADTLWKHNTQIEQTLCTRISDLFGFSTTITLHDLTNTYYEGEVPHNTKAQRGQPKEKRTDCAMVPLGLALDGSGFVHRSQTFAGNVSEACTQETMLQNLGAPPDALVVMEPVSPQKPIFNMYVPAAMVIGWSAVSAHVNLMRMTQSRWEPLAMKRYAAKKWSPKMGG